MVQVYPTFGNDLHGVAQSSKVVHPLQLIVIELVHMDSNRADST